MKVQAFQDLRMPLIVSDTAIPTIQVQTHTTYVDNQLGVNSPDNEGGRTIERALPIGRTMTTDYYSVAAPTSTSQIENIPRIGKHLESLLKLPGTIINFIKFTKLVYLAVFAMCFVFMALIWRSHKSTNEFPDDSVIDQGIMSGDGVQTADCGIDFADSPTEFAERWSIVK